MTRPLTESTKDVRIAGNQRGVSQLFRRPPPLAGGAVGRFQLLITPNDTSPVDTDEPVSLFIPEDLDNTFLVSVEAYIHTAASGDMEFQITNVTTTDDMLSTTLTIDAGELCSKDADVPYVIDPDFAEVSECDEIAVVIVDDGGGDAMGLKVAIGFADVPDTNV